MQQNFPGIRLSQSVVTKQSPSGDKFETAVGLKTHACLHFSMVRITVVRVKLDPLTKPHQKTARHQNWTLCARRLSHFISE